MDCLISSIYYSPVKSLSLESIKSCKITKNNGILNDRIFSFCRGLNKEDSKLIEKNPTGKGVVLLG